MKRLPEDLIPTNDPIMTNATHEIDKEVEAILRNGEHYADYPGYYFYGYVWFEDNKFYCEIWQYRHYKGTISANTPEELMFEVSNKFGYE